MQKDLILDEENLKNKIHTIRGQKVMLDRDLVELYNVKTGYLNRAVKRNIDRFPKNFMFRLTEKEVDSLRCQNGILESGRGKHRKYAPFVFTEQGVSMLSAVLKSRTAIQVSIRIMGAFVSMRKFISQNAEMFMRLDNVERKQFEHDDRFEKVFNAIEDNVLTKKHKTFYDGQIYDAHEFVSNLIKKAKKRIVLIDNYIDLSVLTLFSERREKVNVTIYTKNFSDKLICFINKTTYSIKSDNCFKDSL